MKTLSKIYDSHSQARRVVTELEGAGIPASEISIVANKSVTDHYVDDDETSGAATGAGVGAALGGGAGLLAGLGIMAIPGIGPVVAAGWFASMALGVAAGAATGGIIGALTDAGVPKEHAEAYSEAIRRGGTLVTVRAQDKDIAKVEAILGRYESIDPMSRTDEYRESGWKGYDASAAPYDLTDQDRDRIGRM